jgi:hypothetical protein
MDKMKFNTQLRCNNSLASHERLQFDSRQEYLNLCEQRPQREFTTLNDNVNGAKDKLQLA